jgi:hypothetical protein
VWQFAFHRRENFEARLVVQRGQFHQPLDLVSRLAIHPSGLKKITAMHDPVTNRCQLPV